MKIIKRLAATLVILAVYFGLAHVANSEPLTPQQVERFIASMPELTALGEKHDEGKQHGIDPRRPMGSSLEQMDKHSPAYADLARLSSRHGFTSPEQWANVGDRTIQAYGFAKNSLSADQVKAGYQQGVANVRNDPKLSEKQKEAVLAGMEKGHKRNMDALLAAEKDIPAVQPHLNTLGRLLE